MVNEKIILAKIDDLEKSFEFMFEVKIQDSYSYKYLMIQIEEQMEKILEKVKNLVKENNLDTISFLDFKNSVIKSIHQAGMKRGEYEWVNSFEKKFSI